jgi:hypothetical protein
MMHGSTNIKFQRRLSNYLQGTIILDYLEDGGTNVLPNDANTLLFNMASYPSRIKIMSLNILNINRSKYVRQYTRSQGFLPQLPVTYRILQQSLCRDTELLNTSWCCDSTSNFGPRRRRVLICNTLKRIHERTE